MKKQLINFLQLMRAPAVFTAFSNILAAHLIVTQGNIQWSNLSLLLIASASLYLAGMVLNDCFDYQEDLLDRPERPLPSGRIPQKIAWCLGWLLLAMGVLSALLVGLKQFYIALLLSVLIVTYNAYAKQTLSGIFVMGGCRYVNWLLGLSVVTLNQQLFILSLPIFIYVSSLTLLSTIETTASNRTYIILTGAGMLLCAVIILFMQLSGPQVQLFSIAVLSVMLLLICDRLYKTYNDFSPLQIQKTIKFLVMGIIPLDAVVTLSNASILSAIMILSLLLPGWLLARSMRVT